jgi:hypothetical protein
MPTLTAGDTLSLNDLAGATGNTQNSNVSVGSNFNNTIKSTSTNYTWGISGGSVITLSSNPNSTVTLTVADMNPQSPSAQTTLQGAVSHTLSVTFADGYNDHIGSGNGYNTSKTKPVYSVDSYDGNTDSLCLDAETPITLADGTIIEIGDIEEGTLLKGVNINGLPPSSESHFYDWSTSELTTNYQDVTAVNVVFSFSDNIYDINDGEIVCTNEHPLLVKNSESLYRFKRAELIQVGEFLVKGDGTLVEVTNIQRLDETREVVSLDVDVNDVYLANGYITHNKDEGNTHSDLSSPGIPATLTYTSYNSTEKMLEWTEGTESGTTGITAYDVQVGTTSGGSDTFNFTEYSGTSLNVVAIASGTYYARVRSIDHGLKSGWKTLTFVR